MCSAEIGNQPLGALPVLQDDGTLTAPVEAMTTRFYFGLKR